MKDCMALTISAVNELTHAPSLSRVNEVAGAVGINYKAMLPLKALQQLKLRVATQFCGFNSCLFAFKCSNNCATI